MENGTQGDRDSDRTEGDSTGSREETMHTIRLQDDVDDDVIHRAKITVSCKRTLVSSSGGSKMALQMRPQSGSFRQKMQFVRVLLNKNWKNSI